MTKPINFNLWSADAAVKAMQEGTKPKLPLREDGRIDEALIGISNGAVLMAGNYISLAEFARLIAAHERERCAKWHDKQVAYWNEEANKHPEHTASWLYANDRAMDHYDHAIAIRSMKP